MMDGKKIILRILQAGILVLTLFFLSRTLVTHWSQLQQFEFKFTISLLLLSFIPLIAGLFLVSFTWRLIMRSFGQGISLQDAFRVWTKSEMLKYVPGMVWTFASRAMLAKKDKVLTVASMGIETALKLAAALLLSFLLMFAFFKNIFNMYIVSALVAVGLLSLHPKFFNGMMGAGMKMFKRPWTNVEMRYRDVLLWLTLLVGSWVLIGIGFVLLVWSFQETPDGVSFLIGSFALSWSAGFAFFSVPQGIGVRESVMTLLLRTVMPEGVAVAISLVARIWWTVGDVLVLAVANLFVRRK